MPSSIQLHRTEAMTATSTGNGCHRQPQPPTWRRICLTRGLHLPAHVAEHHTREVGSEQCCSAVVQTVDAPPEAVWSVLSRFDNPQAYKHFLRSCHVVRGDGTHVGDLREVHVISGLPAACSTERLEILDEDRHVISFSVVGGDHRLKNYRSVTTLHESGDGDGTVVIESFVVDVPPGNSEDDTVSFVGTIVRCNLQSLAKLAENRQKPK